MSWSRNWTVSIIFRIFLPEEDFGKQLSRGGVFGDGYDIVESDGYQAGIHFFNSICNVRKWFLKQKSDNLLAKKMKGYSSMRASTAALRLPTSQKRGLMTSLTAFLRWDVDCTRINVYRWHIGVVIFTSLTPHRLIKHPDVVIVLVAVWQQQKRG